jgi:hypothetical protein
MSIEAALAAPIGGYTRGNWEQVGTVFGQSAGDAARLRRSFAELERGKG